MNAPAHTVTTCPVIPLASSDIKNAAVAAVSETVIGRPSGGSFISPIDPENAIIPAPVSWIVRVSGIPEPRTQLTRTPPIPNSPANARVSASTAPHAAVILLVTYSPRLKAGVLRRFSDKHARLRRRTYARTRNNR